MTIKNSRAILLALGFVLFASLACNIGGIGNGSGTPTGTVLNPESSTVPPTPSPAQVAAQTQDVPLVTSQAPIDIHALQSTLVELYQRVNPSVVHILVYTSRNDAVPLGSGSGFVFDEFGRIVTNNHVVEDGDFFEVVFSNGSREIAEVIGRDVDSDLAVIEVEELPQNIVPISLGNSDELQVGQFVIAIGNPFGEQGSMSLGIISGLGRSLESQRQLDDSTGRYSLPQVVQTDAPINPGNSGGPLLNLEGEIVGVNSAIRSNTGVNSGVGFSIPVNAVRRIIPRLIESGVYVYSYLGVQIRSLNLNLQEEFDLPRPSGAYVIDVTENGPADEAGLIAAQGSDGQDGDLIIAIDGEPIQDTESLISYLVFHTDVGQTIEITVIRDGETIELPVTLGARP
jgi:2-alkenal reductase